MAAANDSSPPTAAVTGAPGSLPTAPQPAGTAVQAPPPSGPPIKLPPQPRPPYLLEEQALGVARLNVAVAVVVLGLAFLLASFAVRNGDFWMHLAVGRDIVHGTSTPGSGRDPFAYTTGGAFWANHAWLFDVGLYGLYQVLGGPLLVVLKALLVTALAWVLLQIRRPGHGLWLPAVFTGLALLAMSPRLLLQPAVVSFLFLALTLWLLQRTAPDGDASAPAARSRQSALWLLPPLFALWVNLDGWFVLGLAVVALYLVGEVLQGRVLAPAHAPPVPPLGQDLRLRRLGLVLLASAAACLVNPNLYHAFSLPPELTLSGTTSLLAGDHEFKYFFVSPFSPLYYGNLNVGGSLAGLAFFPLAVAGLASFALTFPRWSWWRLLVWLGFFLLAAWRWHAIPFFAVVAAPIAALNFADLAARPVRKPVHPAIPVAVLAVAGFVLLLMANGKGQVRLALPELVVAGVALALVTVRVAWWLIVINPRSATAAPAGYPARTERGVWVAAVQIAAVLAVLLLALKLGTRTTFYTQELKWPVLPVPFLVFAGFVLGLLAFGVVPTLAYFDRVFLEWPLGGRVLTLVVGLALLVAAWPGWLGVSRQEATLARHAAWTVEPDPSLKQVALRLAELRRQGIIQDGDQEFALAPQLAGYCAWFGDPRDRNFFDHRFGLFGGKTAKTYVDVRDAVDPTAQLESAAAAQGDVAAATANERHTAALARMRQTFRDNHVTHLVLNFNDPETASLRLLGAMGPLLAQPTQWRLAYLDGRSAIFGWRDPNRADAPDRWKAVIYDPAARAFGTAQPERAPAEGAPGPLPQPEWATYVNGAPPRPLKVDEATLHLLRFGELSPVMRDETGRALRRATEAGLVGCAAPAAGPLAVSGLLGYRVCVDGSYLMHNPQGESARPHSPVVDQLLFTYQYGFYQDRDDGPPALALLAVRAARHAVAADPQDVIGYLRLQEAYSTLRNRTRERVWCTQVGELPVIRHVQMVAALERALTLRPDLPEAHEELAELYLRCQNERNGRRGYLDERLKHLNEALRLIRRAGPPADRKAAEAYQEHVKSLEKEVESLNKVVQDQLRVYHVVKDTKAGALPRAQEALSRGLADEALDVLLKATPDDLGVKGTQLELELLITTGQLAGVRQLLNAPENGRLEQGLGDVALGFYSSVPAFHWYQLLVAAADGDYRAADEHCKAIVDSKDPFQEVVLPTPPDKPGGSPGKPRPRRPYLELLAQLIGSHLAEVPAGKPLAWRIAWGLSPWLEKEEQLAAGVGLNLRYRSELMVLRGLLALEAGNTVQAEESFRRAIARGFPPERFRPYLAVFGAGSPLGVATLLPAAAQAAYGPMFEFNGRAAAAEYLRFMDEVAARKK